jgi:hypothetical protein
MLVDLEPNHLAAIKAWAAREIRVHDKWIGYDMANRSKKEALAIATAEWIRQEKLPYKSLVDIIEYRDTLVQITFKLRGTTKTSKEEVEPSSFSLGSLL